MSTVVIGMDPHKRLATIEQCRRRLLNETLDPTSETAAVLGLAGP